MALTVSLVGIVLGLLAAIGIFAPFRALEWLASWRGSARFAVAVGMRLVVGSLFVWVAPACRTPRIIFWLGVATLLTALALLVLVPGMALWLPALFYGQG